MGIYTTGQDDYDIPLLGRDGNVVATLRGISSLIEFPIDREAFEHVKQVARHYTESMPMPVRDSCIGMTADVCIWATVFQAFLAVTIRYDGGKAWSITKVKSLAISNVLGFRANGSMFYPFAGLSLEQTVEIAQRAVNELKALKEEASRAAALEDLHAGSVTAGAA